MASRPLHSPFEWRQASGRDTFACLLLTPSTRSFFFTFFFNSLFFALDFPVDAPDTYFRIFFLF